MLKRAMLQVYVHDAAAAIARYQQAFDATLLELHPNPAGGVYHSELDVYGQILSVADRAEIDAAATTTGNVMQFCLHFSQGDEALIAKAYHVLCEGGTVLHPLGPCDYCDCMADVIDSFGVRWCLFAV